MNASGKERKRALRRLGIGGSIAAFLAAWAIVFGQLVLGHDPAIGAQTTAQAQPKTTQSNDTSSNDSSSNDTSTDDTTSSDTGATAPAPVTTSQS